MPTTSNFGWTTPADTDLVKDGALAIRTLGNGIDTSMAELKGGTTGQVLSKTSNTDMDFTWVTTDDANAIQNAIVDAKGDLIAASAADTPARLAVGNNGETLVANSSTSTGLQWARPAFNFITSSSFSGATVHTFDSVFDSTYDNYRIIVDLNAVSNADTEIGIGVRKSGVGSVNFDSSTYQYQYGTTVTNGTNVSGLVTTAASGYPKISGFVVDLISPFVATNTKALATAHGINSSGQPRRFSSAAYIFNNDSYFGFLVQSSSGNIGGNIKIYGYRN